ncbi:MAG: zinc ribbon domain-containing protein [Actinobacteria bacterium]|nr:zinc ribbon domain-containing protein [Actinomycetota bacterium]
MPVYEYRCPDGHTFEVFQRMSDAPSEVCEICGKGPVEKLLYPVAVHFKGSGFYSTDYGRASRKAGKDGSADGSVESSSGEKSSDSTEKKAPAADKEG